MAAKAVKTQGSEVYVVDSATTVLKIGGITNISQGGSARDQIETTCLDDEVKTFESGLGNAPTDTFDIIRPDADSSTADMAYRKLLELHESGAKVQWYYGTSDGTDPPTVIGGLIVPPTTRSGDTFTASVVDVVEATPGNEVVRATVTLQLSGGRSRTYRA